MDADFTVTKYAVWRKMRKLGYLNLVNTNDFASKMLKMIIFILDLYWIQNVDVGLLSVYKKKLEQTITSKAFI
ncbi:Uncharacterized protein FWK35_00033516 [Aphis craccivora]|uniref:Uncharacterized protein n=1 Tax=Aphis craccivora TaxID=307492 RepID=A0A6G0VMG1_APHCR|nr:Uncharacterized protein FWK35_00033516 [Aphis craccivora]